MRAPATPNAHPLHRLPPPPLLLLRPKAEYSPASEQLTMATANATDNEPAANAPNHPNGNRSPRLHCAMLPFMGLGGHFIPMVDTGLLLAEHGVAVTVYTTQATADRLQASEARARAAALPFEIEVIPFPAELQKPEEFKSFAELGALFHALPQVEDHLRGRLAALAAAGPTCLVVDYNHSWTDPLARQVGIPRYVLYNMPIFTVLGLRLLYRSQQDAGGEAAGSDFLSRVVTIPGIPHRIEIALKQAAGLFPGWNLVILQQEANDTSADGVLVNSPSAFEGEYLELYTRLCHVRKVWPVGPLALANEGDAERAATRGGKSSAQASGISDWLDSMAPKSVVYFALGSLQRLSPAQVEEVAAGLEASGRPFIFVVRVAQEHLQEVEAWLQSSGFVERNKGRGIAITGWAPQQLILSHPSVGGFVTHCGWGSFMEAIAFGVPVGTWPRYGDQFLNERMIVDVLGAGVSVGELELDWHWWWSCDAKIVGRDRVTALVENLMGDSEEAKERRRKAEELMVSSKHAMKPNVGTSRLGLLDFIEDAIRGGRLGRQREAAPEDDTPELKTN